MRSYLLLLLIPLFSFAVFAGSASPGSTAVQSAFSARLSYLEADVRLSLGREGEPYLGKDWIEASAGMGIQEGYSVATQDGRAEVEFENGSMLYLAPHSLLMFYDLSTNDPDGSGTKEFDSVGAKLLAGSVMLLSQFRQDGEFTLETQTARLRTHYSGLYRVTSYLNSTELIDLSPSLPSDFLSRAEPAALPQGTFTDGKIVIKGLEAEKSDAWDFEARERVREQATLTLAALRASGLNAPFGGLVDLYKNGKFTPCGTNETCWEPSSEALRQLATPEAQTPVAAQPPQGSGPGPVVFESEGWEGDACDPVWTHTIIWRDPSGNLHYGTGPASGPQAKRPGLKGNAPWQYAACTTGEFVYTNYRHCLTFKRDHCHHHHHQEGSLHCAKVNGRFGIVRTVQSGAKGTPAVNWKAGVYVLPQKPGERMTHSELSAGSKVTLLHSAPKEYRGGGVENAPRVPQPAITAQFQSGRATVTAPALSAAKVGLGQASYDYKAHGFTVPGDAHPVVVARMNSYGSLSAPAGHSNGQGIVPGLPPGGHAGGGFGGSTGGGGGGHSSGGGGSSSGGGSSHSGGGSSASNAASGTASASSHH